MWAVLTTAPLQAADDWSEWCEVTKPATLPAGPLKLLTLNVSHGRGTALNQLLVSTRRTYANLDAVAALLARTAPDIVALQELDAPSRWSGRFDHARYLAPNAGYACALHGYHSQAWLAMFGTALLSRIAATAAGSQRFAPSWPSKQKGYVLAVYDWPLADGHGRLHVVSVHLDFLRRSTRDRQVQQMIADLRGIDGPLVVMGDFNSAWNDPDSPVRRLGDALGLRAYRPDMADAGTYKSPKGKRLDWVLISAELDYAEYRALPDIVADHLAVYAEIRYRGNN